MAEIKRRRRLTQAESDLISEVAEACAGDWARIMKDARIAQLGYSKEWLATHLANKRKTERRKEREGRGERPKKRVKHTEPESEDDALQALIDRQEALELQFAEMQGTLDEILALVRK